MTTYSLEDLISTSFEQKPLDFADIFGSLLQDRLTVAIDNKKFEIAKNLYNSSETNETTEEE